jgi:sulfite oxidase
VFNPGFIVHSEHPFNAEPPLHRLCAGLITDQSDFYVRSHGDIPHLDEASHRLRVDGLVGRPLDLSMQALRDGFAHRSVTAALQCAGNRRAEMHRVRRVSGDPWAPGAIGNARWTGVALADVLRRAGARDGPSLHVAFSCRDEIDMPTEGRFRYGVSIPMEKAMSSEVLLAFAMNGAPLAPEHGFPLRLMVPGYAGVRSAKWLASVTVQDRPSGNHMQQRDYKLFPSDVSAETVDWTNGITINDMKLTSSICEPAAEAELPAGRVTVKGYAVVSARAIVRVEVSCDGGRTWFGTELEHDPDAPWGWTLWQAVLDLPAGRHELAVRAWDSGGQTQPARMDEVWNFKGYLGTAWHRIRVRTR